MRWLTQLILAIPVVPAIGWIMSNRRRPSAWFCSPADIELNVSDRWFFFIHRMDKNKVGIARDRAGRFSGFFYL
jgi:hypothetical protein